MPFEKADPEKNRVELERLSKTEEGARAVRNFELEYEFRSKLAEARKNANLSQKEISERSGLKQRAVSRIEKCHIDKNITLPVLLQYIDALGLNLSLQPKQ
jgi:ribosome-binding protein aMBF1 (putative translation factor)